MTHARRRAAIGLIAVTMLSACTSERTGPPAEVAAPAAAVMLAQLPVLPERPDIPGYERSCSPGAACSFGPAWTDDSTAPGGHNGCDTRSDVLREQLTDVVIKAGTHGCSPLSGRLQDPYTGTTIDWTKANSDTVEIDHVVPLALAWDLGAWSWTPAQRTAFANDEALVLLAVSRAANRSKSDHGPAEWMPPDASYHCAYATRFTTILAQYKLALTSADRAALGTALTTCTTTSTDWSAGADQRTSGGSR